mmetsp:Transcript_56606/g.132826  ORF Transcript_56606/g.132826 Transcript_56606/m.132826 type:complete len:608 (-) Transcript_56606:158-1981(-)
MDATQDHLNQEAPTQEVAPSPVKAPSTQDGPPFPVKETPTQAAPSAPVKGTPTRDGPPSPVKPEKRRAVEMEETLDLTATVTTALEHLTSKQQETAQAMHSAKKRLKDLKEQVAAYESEATSLAAQQEATLESMTKQSEELAKARQEYESLHQSQSWTRTALDSALGAQEEYRKGYAKTKAELVQTKETLQAVMEQLITHKDAQEELNQLRSHYERMSRRAKGAASKVLGRLTDTSGNSLNGMAYQAWMVVLTEAKAEKDIEVAAAAERERLKEFAAHNKETSRKVLDRMSASSAAGLQLVCFSAWRTALLDEQETRLMENRISESKSQIEAFKERAKADAKVVLDRLSASSDTGLLSTIVGSWLVWLQDLKRERGADRLMKLQEEELRNVVQKKNAEARAILARSLGSTSTGQLSQAFTAWSEVVQQERREAELAAEVQKKLKNLQAKRKGEASQILESIAGKRYRELLKFVFDNWKSGTSQLKCKKQLEKEYREQCQKDMQDLGSELEIAKERAAKVKEQIQIKYVEGSKSMLQEIEQTQQELVGLDNDLQQAKQQLDSKSGSLASLKEVLQRSRESHTQLRAEVKTMVQLHATLEGGIKEIVRS